jgi:hypothetical protein
MENKSLANLVMYISAIGISIFLLFFVIGCTWIGYEVKNQCQRAQRVYDGDCVEALIAQLDDENQTYRNRNDAVWALGQFGDSRSLPVLQKYYTGNIPDREPLDLTLSQYELKKAVNLASGGTNIAATIWRLMIKEY